MLTAESKALNRFTRTGTLSRRLGAEAAGRLDSILVFSPLARIERGRHRPTGPARVTALTILFSLRA